MVAFHFRMPAGIPGAANRVHDATIEAQIIDPDNPPLAYGTGVVIDETSGKVRPPEDGDTIYGVYVRPYPTNSTQDPLGTDTPPKIGEANVMVRGYMTVLLRGTDPAVKGAKAYVMSSGDTPGGVTAEEDLPFPGVGAYFMGPADADGFTEIAVNI